MCLGLVIAAASGFGKGAGSNLRLRIFLHRLLLVYKPAL